MEKIKIILPVALCCISLVSFADENTEEQPPKESKGLTITTKAGETYENCKIREVGPSTITIFHSNGINETPYVQLPKDIQDQFSQQRKFAVKRMLIKKFKSKIERANQDMQKSIPIKLAIGQTGTVQYRIMVVKVIDNNNFLAKIRAGKKYISNPKNDRSSHYRSRSLTHAADLTRGFMASLGNSMPTGRTVQEYQLIWVKGLPTGNIVDEQKVKLPGSLKITGTKTYTTAMGGQNTVYVFEPFDKQKYFGQMKQEFRKELKAYMEGSGYE